MKKSAVELTESKVAKLKPGEKNYRVWDRACPGFGIEVTPAGGKRWVVVTCITAGGTQRRQWHTLGAWPMKSVEDARLEAANLKDQVRKGEDPKAVILARREAIRVDALLDRFYEEHLQVKVSWEGTKLVVEKAGKDGVLEPLQGSGKEPVRLVEKFIRPALGPMIARDVGTSEVADLLFKIKKATPIQANRVRSVLGRIFGKAEVWELRPAGSNPVRVQDREDEPKRDRFLSDQEIIRVGEILRDAAKATPRAKRKFGKTRFESQYVLAAIRLTLLTGMRKGEVLGLRREWVDLDAEEIRIPAAHHKTGRKTGRVRLVRLCTAARELLESLPQVLGNPYVFPGEALGSHLADLQHPWQRIREAAELAMEGEPDEDDPGLHDLRRTFASVAAGMKVPELFISALLGHSAGTTTQIYARVGQDPLKETVEAIGGRIAGLLDGKIDLDQEARENQAKRSASQKQA